MAHYIIQVFVFQLLFFMAYQLLLRRETFFIYNRIYLLGTTVLSYMLPFMQFDVINEQIPMVFRMKLPAVFIGDVSIETTSAAQLLTPVLITQSTIDWSSVLLMLYSIGALVSVIFFLLKLRKLVVIRKTGTLINTSGYQVCELPNSTEAFTFLRTMYLGATISEAEKAHIVAHEKVHIDQWHTLDLLVFEVLKIAFWFNPMVYLYQKQLQSVHEFTADQTVAKQDKTAYYQNLLSQVFGTTSISFTNTFFNHSLINKRIIMLQKSKSNRVSALKYLLVIPFIAGMLVYTSCNNESQEISPKADLTAEGDTEVMQKINELAEAIMKVGNISDEEIKALEFLAAEAKPGDKIYTSVQEYLDDPDAKTYKTVERSKSSDWEGQPDVPFAVIDKVPVFPGCDSQANNEATKNCFSNAIQKHVAENFNTKLANNQNLKGKQRISVQFKITKDGMVSDVKARAPHAILEKEAIRVVNLLPKVTPGMQDDKPVNVLYSLPILFNIEE